MASQELINYIKQTLDGGFSEDQVQAALMDAGWDQSEIEEGFSSLKQISSRAPGPSASGKGFFGRYKKLLLISTVVVVIVPALVYLGLMLYQSLSTQTETQPEAPAENVQAPTRPEEDELKARQRELQEATLRDQARLQDIQSLQEALALYFETSSAYPQNLAALEEAGIIPQVPLDPKSELPYLFTPLGDPALYYSISFLLETNIGTLSSGLQTVTSEKNINADLIQFQEQVVQGVLTDFSSASLTLTDLGQTSFFPGEEALVEITHDPSFSLKSAVLTTDWLKLTDSRSPFRFYFSAPNQPGIYPVKVFGFDAAGTSYEGATFLKVK
jgi:hypothetical protein